MAIGRAAADPTGRMIGNPTEGLKHASGSGSWWRWWARGRMIGNPTEGLKHRAGRC